MPAVLLPVTALVLWRVFFALKWSVLAAAGDWQVRVLKNVQFAYKAVDKSGKATLRAVVPPDRGNNCFRGYPDRGYRVYDACRGSSVSWDCGLSVFCRWLPVIQPMPL